MDGGMEVCVVGEADVVESTAGVMGGNSVGLVDGSVESVLRLDDSGIEAIVVEVTRFEDEESMTMVGEVESVAIMLDC